MDTAQLRQGARVKPKTCRACKAKFVPSRPLQAVCGPQCALTYAAIQREKKASQEAAERAREVREKIKTRQDWQREAQAAFNAYIRERDAEEPCISCGRYHQGQWHAGHYLSTGARPNLRFDERNVHKQCQPCNTHLSGNLVNYRMRLIAKIGLDQVEALEADHAPRKYSAEELRAIRDHYRAALRELKRAKNHT